VALLSPSLLWSRSSTLPKGMLMSPSAAQLVVKQERLSVAVSTVIGQVTLIAKCTKQYALSAARNVKYPSSLERASQYIAASATKR